MVKVYGLINHSLNAFTNESPEGNMGYTVYPTKARALKASKDWFEITGETSDVITLEINHIPQSFINSI